MNRYIWSLLLMLLTSCAFKGNLAGLYSYYPKMSQLNPELYTRLQPADSVCLLKPSPKPKIYLTNGRILQKCLSQSRKAWVYIWGPKCKSKICLPPELLQQKCNAQNTELYIVAEYYDNAQMNVPYKINHPILGIDTQYYQTERTANYLSKFIFDLTATHVSENKYLYFENGHFIKACSFIEDVD